MSSNDRDRLADALAGMGAAPAPPPAAAATPQADEVAAPRVGTRPMPPAPVPAIGNDDDAVSAPAPDAAVFAPRQTTAALVARQRLEQKRTLIPILLTGGVLLPAVASLKWLAARDTVFAEMELWVPFVMIAAGVMLLGVAGLNMMQVRHELAARRRP